jgi:hypothetical protein
VSNSEIINNVDSDADPGSLSQVPVRIFFLYLDPRSRILDPESRMPQKQKEEREKIN